MSSLFGNLQKKCRKYLTSIRGNVDTNSKMMGKRSFHWDEVAT